jgi:CheY-like chemotaxis protein
MGQVLIVDDDSVQRALMREVLEDEGYRVTEAAEGSAALDLLRNSSQRCVVLLDYFMPGLGGKGLLQLVSQDTLLRARHVYVLLTARRRLSLSADVANILSTPVVYKPYDLNDLLVKVAEAQKRLEVSGSGSS